MARLLCTFCGNEWDQSPAEVWHCEECTMWAAKFEVMSIPEADLEVIWAGLDAIGTSERARTLCLPGHNALYEMLLDGDLERDIDLLVLLFDRVVVSRYHHHVSHNDPVGPRLQAYFDADAVVPLDMADVSRELSLGYGDDFAIRVRDSGRYLDILADISYDSKGPAEMPYWFLLNLAHILTHLDIRTGRADIRALYRSYVESGTLDSYYTYFPVDALNSLNYMRLVAQLLGLPLLVGPRHGVLVRSCGDEPSPKRGSLSTAPVMDFLDRIQVRVPRGVTAREVLDLRASDEWTELRALCARLVQEAQRAEGSLPLRGLREECRRVATLLDDRARSFANSTAAVVAGCISTLGALAGGVGGAIAGGVGGTVAGLGLRRILQRLYRKTGRNWTYYLHQWRGSRSRQGGRPS